MEKQCYRNGFPRLSAVKKLCNTFEYEAENAHTLMCWNEWHPEYHLDEDLSKLIKIKIKEPLFSVSDLSFNYFKKE